MRRPAAVAALVISVLLGLTLLSCAQEPILRFRATSEQLTIEAGQSAVVRIEIENRSIHEADDIEMAWLEPEPFGLASEPEPIKVLQGFGSDRMALEIVAPVDAPLGETSGVVEIVYTYCIGELCFQIVEELGILLVVEARRVIEPIGDEQTASVVVGPTTVDPIERVSDSFSRSPGDLNTPGGWLLLVGLVGIALGALTVIRRRRWRWVTRASFVAVLAFALGIGILYGQHDQAQSIGSVLCISCVGLEESQPVDRAELSGAALEALGGLNEDVELVVFSAEWCHACPYAKAMVGLMADATPRITYEVVDVDVAPERAVEAGIVESGKTVVPAIIRVGKGEVLFGTEDLEHRLLELIGLGAPRP